MVKDILANRTVITHRAAEVPPCVRAEAAIVVDQARRRAGRGARHGVAALAAGHQPLDDARCDCPTWCVSLVLGKPLLGACKGFVIYDPGDSNLDPIITGPFVIGAVPRSDALPESKRAGNALAPSRSRFPEAGSSPVSGIAKHGPDGGALPTRQLFACRHLPLVEQARDRANAQAVDGIAVINHPDDRSLSLDDLIIGRYVIALANIAVAIGSPAEHANLALARAVALAAARTFQDLCPLIFSDHPLELQKQLIFCRLRPWCL